MLQVTLDDLATAELLHNLRRKPGPFASPQLNKQMRMTLEVRYEAARLEYQVPAFFSLPDLPLLSAGFSPANTQQQTISRKRKEHWRVTFTFELSGLLVRLVTEHLRERSECNQGLLVERRVCELFTPWPPERL
jgi:hypothetical protein